MSFMGGAECSTAGNPLSQFQKHVQDDKTLQRDRLVGRGPNQMNGFRSQAANAPQDEVMPPSHYYSTEALARALVTTKDGVSANS